VSLRCRSRAPGACEAGKGLNYFDAHLRSILVVQALACSMPAGSDTLLLREPRALSLELNSSADFPHWIEHMRATTASLLVLVQMIFLRPLRNSW